MWIRCKRCKRKLKEDMFFKDRDGFSPICKTCTMSYTGDIKSLKIAKLKKYKRKIKKYKKAIDLKDKS